MATSFSALHLCVSSDMGHEGRKPTDAKHPGGRYSTVDAERKKQGRSNYNKVLFSSSISSESSADNNKEVSYVLYFVPDSTQYVEKTHAQTTTN